MRRCVVTLLANLKYRAHSSLLNSGLLNLSNFFEILDFCRYALCTCVNVEIDTCAKKNSIHLH